MNRRDPRIGKTIMLLCLMAAAINTGMAIQQLAGRIGGSRPMIMGVAGFVVVALTLFVLLRDIWKD